MAQVITSQIASPDIASQLESMGDTAPPDIAAQLENGTDAEGFSPETSAPIKFLARNVPHWQQIGDVASGFAQHGIGLRNAPYYIPKDIADKYTAIGNKLGVLGGLDRGAGNILGQVAQKIGQVLPPQQLNTDAIFGVRDPKWYDKALKAGAPYAAEAVATGASSILAQMGLGAFHGATSSDTPIESAAIEGGLNALIGVGAKALSQSGAKNAILSYLRKGIDKTGIPARGNLTPAEAAENVAQNYTLPNGQPMNVDIGTATNAPVLKGTYGALKYSPFSGQSKEAALFNRQLQEKAVNDLTEQAGKDASMATASHDQNIANMQKDINTHGEATNYVNSLTKGTPYEGTNFQLAAKQELNKAYRFEKSQADINYAPLHASKVDLTSAGKVPEVFQNYGNAANQLLAQRQNFENLFGTGSDLGSKLNHELDIAKSSLNPKEGAVKYGYSVPEVVTRLQNIGKMAAAASNQGKNNEARMLMNLYDGLKDDANTALQKTGNADLATQFQKATDHYRDNVVPFWANNEINKAVTETKYLPDPNKLAKALHDPNNQVILNKLSNDGKNAMLSRLITEGKQVSSKGITTMDATDVAKRYAAITPELKSTIQSYNPNANSYFENLSQYTAPSKGIDALQTSLNAAKQARQKALQDIGSKFQDNLKQLQQNKFGVTGKAPSSTGSTLVKGGLVGAGIAGTMMKPLTLPAMLPAIIAGRVLTKAMRSPELLQAYLKGTNIPQSGISKAIASMLQTGAISTTTSRRQ